MMAHGLTESQVKTLREFAHSCACAREDIRLWMEADALERDAEDAGKFIAERASGGLWREAVHAAGALRLALNGEMFSPWGGRVPSMMLHEAYCHAACAESWLAQSDDEMAKQTLDAAEMALLRWTQEDRR